MNEEYRGMKITPEDRGPYIHICGGGRFHLLDPKPDEIEIEHIATSLSRMARFTGHTRLDLEPISVAQHSVFVSRVVTPDAALWGLLHDAHEAYTNDITHPMKVCLDKYAPGALSAITVPIQKAICNKFALPWPQPDIVKYGDMVALVTEKRDTWDESDADWLRAGMPDPHSVLVAHPMNWRDARKLFLDRFLELT